jgi:hypothetical protein
MVQVHNMIESEGIVRPSRFSTEPATGFLR